ncbi:hypothetical protein [Paraflavitalea speifideaquila]|uniref:hypothetical protein n=1 Tax=Paraflavitalea speifideaquila TaxID=3076558 RepID=UPI0028EC09CA|nr:hypothetical protein [Paraflavitalea speifideiaquila]
MLPLWNMGMMIMPSVANVVCRPLKKGCCHTEYKLVKLQDEHRLAQAQVAFLALPAEAPAPLSTFQLPVAGEDQYLALQYHPRRISILTTFTSLIAFSGSDLKNPE